MSGCKSNVSSRYKEGDTVRMELNVKQKQLQYFVNDKDADCIFDIKGDSNITYNMAVFAGNTGNKIQLVKFEKSCA